MHFQAKPHALAHSKPLAFRRKMCMSLSCTDAFAWLFPFFLLNVYVHSQHFFSFLLLDCQHLTAGSVFSCLPQWGPDPGCSPFGVNAVHRLIKCIGHFWNTLAVLLLPVERELPLGKLTSQQRFPYWDLLWLVFRAGVKETYIFHLQVNLPWLLVVSGPRTGWPNSL